jgi:hypothetical protein
MAAAAARKLQFTATSILRIELAPRRGELKKSAKLNLV